MFSLCFLDVEQTVRQFVVSRNGWIVFFPYIVYRATPPLYIFTNIIINDGSSRHINIHTHVLCVRRASRIICSSAAAISIYLFVLLSLMDVTTPKIINLAPSANVTHSSPPPTHSLSLSPTTVSLSLVISLSLVRLNYKYNTRVCS